MGWVKNLRNKRKSKSNKQKISEEEYYSKTREIDDFLEKKKIKEIDDFLKKNKKEQNQED